MNAWASVSRRPATRATSGVSRRITRTAKPHCRQCRYWYTERASSWGVPSHSISENQQGLDRGGERIRWGYQFSGGFWSMYSTMVASVRVLRPGRANEEGRVSHPHTFFAVGCADMPPRFAAALPSGRRDDLQACSSGDRVEVNLRLLSR
jgi:hypothetical protein